MKAKLLVDFSLPIVNFELRLKCGTVVPIGEQVGECWEVFLISGGISIRMLISKDKLQVLPEKWKMHDAMHFRGGVECGCVYNDRTCQLCGGIVHWSVSTSFLCEDCEVE